MKQKNDTDAHALLQTTLETKNLYYARLSIANAKDLCNGRWARHNSNMPSGLSVLLVQEYDMLSGHSPTNEAMILRLKTKHSIDDAAISKLLETDITMPTLFEGMMENIKVVDGIIESFAPNSWPARCYENIISDLLRIEKDCKKLILEDSLFIIKILSDIDNRTARYLEDCRLNTTSFESINHSRLDMSDIAQDIQAGKYNFTAVPSCIKPFSPPSAPAAQSPAPNHGAPSRNRGKRQKSDAHGQLATNNNQHPDLKMDALTENFSMFNVQDLNHMVDPNFCKRWHIKGTCTSSCTRMHESNPMSIPKFQISKAKAFMDQCRRRST